MSSYLITTIFLICGFFLVRFLLNGDPARIARTFKFGIGLAMGILGLLISMRGLYVFGMPLGLYGFFFAARAMGWRGMPGLRIPGLALDGAPGPSSGSASGVRTRYLEMVLDHQTGAMDGLIREGDFKGRRLAELTQPEAMTLLRTIRLEDPESERLLEAWLDRTWPHWREMGGNEEPGQRRSSGSDSGPMTRAEALRVLELDGNPSADDVREAYKQQMKLHHPDQGGSVEQAARLNQARDVLLNS